ncbi:MAG: hypothetical protein KF791_13895 [Verrucomicrobiae bacterium]|nr:hypothetical protein [Verrucomicrobiae bacterium]
MKKPLIIATTVILLISFVGALLIWSYSDAWVAAGIRTYGPRITKTSVNVDSVKLSRDGTGTIRGLVVGNPAPYQEPFAIRLGQGTVSLDPASLTSGKVVVRSLVLESPEIQFEGGIQDNNLKQLLANMNSGSDAPGSDPSASDTGSSKRLQVDEVAVNNARVHLKLTGVAAIAGSGTSVTIPNIRLTGLGTGPEGITPAALSKAVLSEVVRQVGPAVASKLGGLQPGALDALRDSGDALKKSAQGLERLIPQKK